MSTPVVCVFTRLARSMLRVGDVSATHTRCVSHHTYPESHSSAQQDEDLPAADHEEKLEELIRQELKRQKSIKFHKLRRQMTPRGAPERRLSWEAIEQIRYLKREYPEEWTLERLAQGFSVTSDVIARVLRTKFCPAPERRAQQDARVLSRHGCHGSPALPAGTPGPPAPAVISAGKWDTAARTLAAPVARTLAVPVALMVAGGMAVDSRSGIQQEKLPVSMPPSVSHVTPTSQTQPAAEEQSPEDRMEYKDEEDEEGWDGTVLSEQELEELAKTKPQQTGVVVQKGREFYDNQGNFLYRL